MMKDMKLTIALASAFAGRCFGTFALILTLTPAFGVSALIALGSNPHDILPTFVGTCALMFGVGAALTGLVFKLTEDMP